MAGCVVRRRGPSIRVRAAAAGGRRAGRTRTQRRARDRSRREPAPHDARARVRRRVRGRVRRGDGALAARAQAVRTGVSSAALRAAARADSAAEPVGRHRRIRESAHHRARRVLPDDHRELRRAAPRRSALCRAGAVVSPDARRPVARRADSGRVARPVRRRIASGAVRVDHRDQQRAAVQRGRGGRQPDAERAGRRALR